MNSEPTFRVVVLGAGPAGATTALLLARRGVSVALVELDSLADRDRQPIEQYRCDTLPPETNRLLAELSLADSFSECRPVECPGIVSRWFDEEVVEHDFLYSPFGSAWHVHRRRFDRWLLAHAFLAGAVCLDRSRVQRITALPGSGDASNDWGGWRLEGTFRDVQRSLSCEYVVLATGRGRRLAEMFDAIRHTSVARQAARSLLPCVSQRRDARLYLERLADGWAAVTPYDDERQQVTLVAGPEFFRGPDWTKEIWERLSSSPLLAPRLGEPRADATWRTCAADLDRLVPATGRGWLAVGDAALALDPLAGQGLYWSLQTARHAANVATRFLGVESDANELEYSRDAGEYSTFLEQVFSRMKQQHAEWHG